MSAPDVTLNIDYSGAPFGSAFTWSDFTDYLIAVDGATDTFGRADEQGDPPPRTCSFTLKNDTGLFSPGDPTFPALFPATFGGLGWDVGTPVQIQVTVSGVTYDRFTGYVDSIEPTWPGGVQSWSVVRVSATDITSRLAVSQPLRSLVVQEMLADNPTYLYPLDEPQGAASAGDISGNAQPAAVLVNGKAGGTGTAFGADVALSDPTTGLNFGDVSTYERSGVVTVAAIASGSGGPVIPSAGAHTIECWIVGPTAAPTYLAHILSQYEPRTLSPGSLLWLYAGENHPNYFLSDGTNFTQNTTTRNICDGRLHHLVVTFASDLKTTKLYIDGVLESTEVAGAAMNFGGKITWNSIGGVLTPASVFQGAQFPGTICNVAMYPTALSAARILEHYKAGIGTLTESSDDRYARIAGYGPVTTSGLPTGSATMGAQNLAGQSITDALQTVARTENTVSYTTGSGALTFQARDVRYNATTALTLDASEIEAPPIRRDRQGFANEITVTRNGGSSQRVVDSASQTQLGRFDGGSFDVAPATDEQALHIAEWQVAVRKTSQTRVPSVRVNLLAATNAIRTACLSADISTLLTLTNLPANAPFTTVDLFVEGWTEKIAYDEWWIEFFTSQDLPFTQWVLGDATLSVLGSTTRTAL